MQLSTLPQQKIGEFDLRMLELEDASPIYDAVDHNRTYLRKWLAWVDTTNSPKDTENFILRTLAQIKENSGFACGIWDQEKCIGIIGTVVMDNTNKFVEVGYWVDEKYSSKGIATKATNAFIIHFFETLQLNRVEIRCATENIASQCIPKKLGFTHEGTLRKKVWLHDRFIDHEIFSLLREEWNQQ